MDDQVSPWLAAVAHQLVAVPWETSPERAAWLLWWAFLDRIFSYRDGEARGTHLGVLRRQR
jgi:hypothetical protein